MLKTSLDKGLMYFVSLLMGQENFVLKLGEASESEAHCDSSTLTQHCALGFCTM
jgi:hypothetical protein